MSTDSNSSDGNDDKKKSEKQQGKEGLGPVTVRPPPR
jgi:hypothetical protein